jgi:hypothetical protein
LGDAAPRTGRWSQQHDLLVRLDASVNRALTEVGAPLSPSVHLVGLSDAPPADEAPLVLLGLTGTGGRAACEHLAAVLDPTPREARAGWEDVERGALERALQTAPGGAGRCFFAAHSVPVGNYVFFPALSFDQAAMETVPGMVGSDENGAQRRVSLVHEVIAELLRSSTLALLALQLSSMEAPSLGDPATKVLRRAARRMVTTVGIAAGTVASTDLFDTFEALASTAYEGRTGKGGVLLVAREHDLVDVLVRLRSSVPVQNLRQFRKLLELTGPRLDLLTDGTTVYGLGRISARDERRSQTIFRFEVVKHGEWRLSHDGQQLLEVDHGRPRLPRPRISLSRFQETMQRVFPDSASGDVEAIWRLAQAVSVAPYGAMLVVSRAAEQEAARLAAEALVIEPTRIDAALLDSMTRIDGAVLLTPDCVCHGIGVILDGIATGTGDPGRGSRYNSAVRYATTAPAPCVIVIVSEDGTIDLHPHPDREASPDAAERALDDLERAATQEPVDLNRFFTASGRLRLLTSRLSPVQCERANEAWRLVAARHKDRTGLPLVVVPFVPRHHAED